MLRPLIISVVLIAGIAIGVYAFAALGSEAQAPPSRPSIDITAVAGKFTDRRALGMLEKAVRELCATSDSLALTQQLERVRRATPTQDEDFWAFALGDREARVFVDGTVSGSLVDFANRECLESLR